MTNPVRQTIHGDTRYHRAGFTLIEVLVALFVMGVATTVLVSMYTQSLSMGRTSRTNDVAMNIAEEYMNELRVHPDLFDWPDYTAQPDTEDGFYNIKLYDKGDGSIFLVSPSNAEAPDERTFNRDKKLYRSYGWHAYAHLNKETDNYVEVTVQIQWLDGGIDKNLCLTSLLPRSIAEGVG